MEGLASVKSTLKDARNAAYLCKYNESVKLYKQIIDAIEQQIILNQIPRSEIESWRRVEADIISEKNAVETVQRTLNLFGGSGAFSPYGFNKFQRQGEESAFGSNHFLDGQNDGALGPSCNPRATRNNFSIKKIFKPNDHKDPDVWEPPPPIQKVRKRNLTVGKGGNVQTSQKRDGRGIQKAQAKSNFLNNRYPDGQGPDANLIEMLEREVLETSPNVNFDDIAELETAKGLLQQAVLLPLKLPQYFTGIRRAWKGVLLFGPPGTGKTLLAKAVASAGGTKFFNVSASSLASKWKGESEKLVRILFEMARFYAPSVIFFDEIDSLGGKRKENEDESNRKVKTELLVQMDGTNSGPNQANKFVIVLAATNRPWDLDEALRRRLEKRIYIPLPNELGRKELLKIHLKTLKVAEELDLDFICKKTDGYSGADITNICREAAYMPMRRKLKAEGGLKGIQNLKKFQEDVNIPLTKDDFIQALKNVNKSVGKDDLAKYQAWMKEFGSI